MQVAGSEVNSSKAFRGPGTAQKGNTHALLGPYLRVGLVEFVGSPEE